MTRRNIIDLTRMIHKKKGDRPSSTPSFDEKMLDMAFQLYLSYWYTVKEATTVETAAEFAWRALDVFMKKMPGNDKSDS